MQMFSDPPIRPSELEQLVSAFRLLADPGRLRLVAALLEERELSVRELSRAAALSETATSQQLRVLREAGVVRRRRLGRQILYRLNGGEARALARTGIARAAFRSSYSKRKDAVVTYIIAEPCIDIKDKSCVDVCPVDCIHEFDRILVIDPEECIDCGACEPECPVEAIFPEDALPDKWNDFVEINYAFRDAPDGETAETINRLVDDYAREHNVQNEPLT
jgi:NAD-dependent dihydropyrimidine dehydrogenase PreA subunit/DNA-binding MarR family transcriptional regulator